MVGGFDGEEAADAGAGPVLVEALATGDAGINGTGPPPPPPPPPPVEADDAGGGGFMVRI